MSQREFAQQDSPGAGELYTNLPAVLLALHADNRAEIFQPINQFYSAVMFKPQSICEITNRGPPSFWKPSHSQQQLMLLRLKAISSSLSFAEKQEFSDLIPEFGKSAVVRNR